MDSSCGEGESGRETDSGSGEGEKRHEDEE